MNKKINFEISHWTSVGNALLKKALHTLQSAPSEQVRDLVKRIPVTILPEEEAITLVFAGQYSAGKSTILKVLTEKNDIATGAGITTQEAHTYDWNGIKVIDTPGVHTQLRPDHDEISYQAIASADLLVFVITNELFDSYIAQHFRKLAIEKDKAHEILLIVNKMRRCVKGNTTEMQDIIREDLRKVLLPFSPEDLRLCFIDAESSIDSLHESDPEFAAALWRKSGIDAFMTELNNFVQEKGLISRHTTALYNLEQVLQEALTAESTGDIDVDATEELFLQKRRALLETKERIPRAVEKEIQNVGAKVRQDGRKVADFIHGNAKKEEVDHELQKAQERVEKYAEECGQSIETLIIKQMEELDERLGNILNSEFAKELSVRLEHRIKDADISPESLAKMKASADVSQKLGKFLIENSFKAGSGAFSEIFKLANYSGTKTHELVKIIENFFGKKFKPWEAIKWTKNIAHAGRVFVVAGTVLTFVLQFKEDADAAQLEIDLRESRALIRNGFNDAAHAIETHFDKATGAYITETFDPEIESVDKQLSELREMQQSRSDLFQDLGKLLKETKSLIKELHTNNRAAE